MTDTVENIYSRLLAEAQLGLTPVADTANRVASILNKNGLDYVVIGGYAVHMYGYHRYTVDVDFVVKDREYARQILLMNGFKPNRGSSMTVTDTKNGVEVDLLNSGKKDSPSAIPYPDTNNATEFSNSGNNVLKVVSLEELIALKLGAYLSAGAIRHKDMGDVVGIIQSRNLSKTFMSGYNDKRIVDAYQKLWDDIH